MKKRERGEEEGGERSEEGGSRGGRKKAKMESDPLKKFLSLVESGDSAAGLTYFLSTVQREEEATLIGAYLQQCPSCEAILAPLKWERDKQTPDMMLLCFECLESILLHTASLQTQSDSGSGMGQSPGHKLVGTILRGHMRPLYSALMTSCPMRLVAACLRLLTAMVMQGTTTARDIQQTFNFTYKPLSVFPNRTNRIKGTSDSVRTCFIKFSLSFLIAGDNDVIRNILQLKKFLSSVFKLLPEDPVEIVHLFLSTLREKVLRNGGVSKRAKSALFNHYALKQLSWFLGVSGESGEEVGAGRRVEECEVVSEGTGGETMVISLSDYVLEVLTELCTSFQYGVCYRAKTDSLLAGRTNNSAILTLLLSLTGSLSDAGVQSLVSRAIATCPDLLAPYLQTVGLSFEPRPNSKWIDNIHFLIRLLSGLPPVAETLGITSGGCGRGFPLSVPAAVSMSIPSAISRAFLNQGVQNSSPLVKLKTLDLIHVILQRAVATTASPRVHESPDIASGSTASGKIHGSVSFGFNATSSKDSTSIGLTGELASSHQANEPSHSRLTTELATPGSIGAESATSSVTGKAATAGRTTKSGFAVSVVTTYSDTVLKLLPELKTLVNLRQTLYQGTVVSGARRVSSTVQQAKASDSLSTQHRLANAALLEDSSSLLTRCLEVMRGYQTLSPSLFLQADFNPAKLLPSLAHLAPDRAPIPPSVLLATLKLLEETPSGLFNWQHQKSGVLSSLLWLVVCDDREIYNMALKLSLKLLLSVESLSGLEVELGVVLTSARRFANLCLPEERGSGEEEEEGRGEGEREKGPRTHFVEMLAEVLLAMSRDPQQFTKFQMPPGNCDPNADSPESLTSILAAPLDVPTVTEVLSSLSGAPPPQPPPLSPSPLLLSVVLGMDCEKYFPFVCDVVVKLLLGQSDPQVSRHAASVLISLTDKWRNSSWQGLCESMTALLQSWTNTCDMEVEGEVSEFAQLSSRKCVKRLMKMATHNPTGAVQLLTGVSREVFIDCVVAVATKPHLHQALLYTLGLRPLQLVLYRDNPAVRELLPSLPLPSLVLQCLQLEPTLSLSLNQLPCRQWRDSLRASVEERDWFGVLCVTRTMSALLQQVYSNENVGGVPVADMCFHVLELTLNSLASHEKVADVASHQDNPLFPLSSLGSLLTTSVFASPLGLSLLGPQQAGVGVGEKGGMERGEEGRRERGKKGKRKEEGGREREERGVEGLGRLLSTALLVCEEFRTSPLFRRLFLGLMERISIVNCEDTDISEALLDVLDLIRPHLDSSLLCRGIECLLHTLTLSPAPHILPHALLTLFSPPHSSPEAPPATPNILHSSTATNNSVQNVLQTNGDAPVCCLSNEPHSTPLTNHRVNPITEDTVTKGTITMDTVTKETITTDTITKETITKVSPRLSDSVLRQLLEATLRPGCTALTGPALTEVCSRLCTTTPRQPCAGLAKPSPAKVCSTTLRPKSALSEVCTGLPSMCPAPDLSLTSWAAVNLDWGYDHDNRGFSDTTRSVGESEKFVRQLQVLVSRASLKGLCPPFFLREAHRRSCSSEPWLPRELLHQLLESGVGEGAGVGQTALAGCILQCLPHRSLEYFSTACLPGLCCRVASGIDKMAEDEEGGCSLETDLFSLCLFLAALARHRAHVGDVDWCKETSRTVCKLVWKKCVGLIPTSHDLIQWPTLQGLSVRILCFLCQLTSKARKKVKTLSHSWDVSDTPWTSHQMCVVTEGGCAGEGDTGLGVMAVRRLLARLAVVSSGEQGEVEGEKEREEVGEGEKEKGEKGWIEECAPLLCRLLVVLKSLGFGKEPLNIPPQTWNLFFKKSTRRGVKLSSVLGCLCAGVKVLYTERREEEGKRGEEGGKRKRKGRLVSLSSIHSKLWGHSEFPDILYSTSNSPPISEPKERAVELLVFITERCSDVVCGSRVSTLLGAYSASCSRTDRGLLYLLYLYELNGENLSRLRPYLWGQAGREVERERQRLGWLQWAGPPSSRQVLESLEPNRINYSLNLFPQLAPLEPVDPFDDTGDEGRSEEEYLAYDPAFLLPLASHLLDPSAQVEVREVARTGVLSYLLVSLSSHEANVRRAAAHCLSRFSTHVRSSSAREKPQLSLLLRVVKNTLEEKPQRLPSLHALFLARVAQVFLQPECQLYMMAGHYLVHKPALELRDIPLFNALFLNTPSSMDGGEIEWLLGVLAGGLRCEEDYRLYQRKRVLPHLMALFTGLSLNSKTRTCILEVVLRGCWFHVGVSDLVWNHGLLPWLSQANSPGDRSVVQKILSKVCALVEEEERDSERGWKPPPLLEEELSLTTARFMSAALC